MFCPVCVTVLEPACEEFCELREKYEKERTYRVVAEDVASKVIKVALLLFLLDLLLVNPRKHMHPNVGEE